MATNMFVLLLLAFVTLALAVENHLPSFNHSIVIQEKKELVAALQTNKIDPHLLSSYSVSIYHRDMFERSNFRDENSIQEARLARDASRARYIASVFGSPESKSKSKDDFTDFDHPFRTKVYGEHLVSFFLGSKPVKNLLLLDLGSQLLWWQCAPCDPNKCYTQLLNDTMYNSKESSWFEEVDCASEPLKCILDDVMTCSQLSNRCYYEMGYGSGQLSRGYMSYEMLTFVLTGASKRIEFGCGNDQTGGASFEGRFDGIAGLGGGLYPEGSGRYSLTTQMYASLFSFCLPSPSAIIPSTLNFHTSPWMKSRSNGINASLFRNDNHQTFYFVQLTHIVIAGEYEIEIQPSTWDGRVFVDSGSLYTHLPQYVYSSLKSHITFELIDKATPDRNAPYDLCYDTSKLSLDDIPSVALYFNGSDGSPLYLDEKEVVFESNGRYCLAFFPADGPYAYIGNNQLHRTALTFDLSAMSLTFHQNACA